MRRLLSLSFSLQAAPAAARAAERTKELARRGYEGTREAYDGSLLQRGVRGARTKAQQAVASIKKSAAGGGGAAGPSGRVLGRPLGELCAQEGVPVPLFLAACAEHVAAYGADGAVGGRAGCVFDQPPLATPESVIDAFYASNAIVAATPPADAAAAMLHFLYLLPEPLIPTAFYEAVVSAGREDAASMAELLPQVPECSRAALQCVCSAAARLVAAGHCSAATIAETLAPALCRREAGASNAGAHDAADMSQALVADAIAWLIANVDDLVRAAEGAEDLLD